MPSSQTPADTLTIDQRIYLAYLSLALQAHCECVQGISIRGDPSPGILPAPAGASPLPPHLSSARFATPETAT